MKGKLIIIVNGKPRAGKDTFALLLNKLEPVYKYSIIDKVKAMALDCGWKGGKTEKDRKFLSDLKKLTNNYSDMSYEDVTEKTIDFYCDRIKERVLLIDMREAKDIDMAKEYLDAITVFIKNDNVESVTSNKADANVENYKYDYYIENNGTIKDFETNVRAFYFNIVVKIIKKDYKRGNMQ